MPKTWKLFKLDALVLVVLLTGVTAATAHVVTDGHQTGVDASAVTEHQVASPLQASHLSAAPAGGLESEVQPVATEPASVTSERRADVTVATAGLYVSLDETVDASTGTIDPTTKTGAARVTGLNATVVAVHAYNLSAGKQAPGNLVQPDADLVGSELCVGALCGTITDVVVADKDKIPSRVQAAFADAHAIVLVSCVAVNAEQLEQGHSPSNVFLIAGI